MLIHQLVEYYLPRPTQGQGAWRCVTTLILLLAIVLLPAPLAAQSSEPSPSMQSTLAGRSNTVQRIRSRGNQLLVGFLADYAPYSFLDEEGLPAGFEPALVRAVAERWDVEVTFVPVTPANRLQRLLAGQVDLLAAALPHTLTNEVLADFSADHLKDESALLIPAESQIINFQDLAGKTVATVQGTAAIAQLEAQLAALDVEVSFLPFPEPAAALSALKAGQAHALLGDRAHLTLVASEQLSLSVLLPLDGNTYFGFGVAPGDSLFRTMLNATLQELQTAGVYDEIYAEWFPTQLFPHVAATLASMPTLLGSWPYTFKTLPITPVAGNTSRLSTLRTRGTLLVGVAYDLPPFGFLDQTGAVTGFEIDLIHEFARRWLGDGDAVEFVRVTPDTAVPLLRAGQVDLLATALPQSWLRTAEVDFSSVYYHDTLGVLTRQSDATQTLADLAGKTFATVAGVSGWRTILPLLANTLAAEPTVLPFHEYRTAEQALLAGQIDAVIGGTAILAQMAATSSDLALLPETLGPQPYGIALPQSDAELRDLVNITLQTMHHDGSYAALYQQWFGEAPSAPLLWLQRELALQPDTMLAALQTVDKSVPEIENALAALTPRQLVLQPVAMDSKSNNPQPTPIPELSTAVAVVATAAIAAADTLLQSTPTTAPVPTTAVAAAEQPADTILVPTAAPVVAQAEPTVEADDTATTEPLANNTATNDTVIDDTVTDTAGANDAMADAVVVDETAVVEPTASATAVADVAVADAAIADAPVNNTAVNEVTTSEPAAGGMAVPRASMNNAVTPVSTPVPTAVPTRAVAPTSTPLPTVTSLPTATVAKDEPLEVVLTKIAVPTATSTSVTAVASSLPPTVTVLGTTNINVRVQPTTSAPIFKVIGGGTSWQTVALSADGEWIQIALTPDTRGWVARHLVAEAAAFLPLTAAVLPAIPASSALAAATPTPRLLFATSTTHQVGSTDSLASIAQEYYGRQRSGTGEQNSRGDSPAQRAVPGTAPILGV